MSYSDDAMNDACDMAEHFLDQIVDQLVDDGEASEDFNNDYDDGDSYHHENHVDRLYDLLDAAELLDELSNYIETDNGLWQGQEPEKAIGTQAAYTYGNAVGVTWCDLIGRINQAYQEFRDELSDQEKEDEFRSEQCDKAREIAKQVIEENRCQPGQETAKLNLDAVPSLIEVVRRACEATDAADVVDLVPEFHKALRAVEAQ
jgi:hypothetical protein